MEYPNCPICSQPLSEGEISLNRLWHFDCERCVVCGKSMQGSITLIEKCLQAGEKISHTACKHALALERLRQKLPSVKADIDALNNEILAFRESYSIIPDDLPLLMGILISYKEAAANVSDIVATVRRKLSAKSEAEFSETVQKQKREKQTAVRAKEESRQETAERAARLAAERENPELRNRRKAIEALSKYMPIEEATAKVDSQLAKAKGTDTVQ